MEVFTSHSLSGTGIENVNIEKGMIEQILTGGNLLKAMHQVQKNHGSAGIDHMPVTKLTDLMAIDREALVESVRSCTYLPQPILGVAIPKGNGKTRLLGIPTVTDRLLQQAVLLHQAVLSISPSLVLALRLLLLKVRKAGIN